MSRVELFYQLNRLPRLIFLGSKQDARRDLHDLGVGLVDENNTDFWNTWQISYRFNFVRKTEVHR